MRRIFPKWSKSVWPVQLRITKVRIPSAERYTTFSLGFSLVSARCFKIDGKVFSIERNFQIRIASLSSAHDGCLRFRAKRIQQIIDHRDLENIRGRGRLLGKRHQALRLLQRCPNSVSFAAVKGHLSSPFAVKTARGMSSCDAHATRSHPTTLSAVGSIIPPARRLEAFSSLAKYALFRLRSKRFASRKQRAKEACVVGAIGCKAKEAKGVKADVCD